ncbi:MAG: metallophosphoesterase family protein [Gammaproteobacteria bacterium]|nr:metallophosphoesterase family protein [Gammaproteobacteria bacterium]
MKSGYPTSFALGIDPSAGSAETENDALNLLARRFGADRVERRLQLEADYAQHVRQFGYRLFHFDSWYSAHSLIRNSLRLVGLHERARRNARAVRLCENEVFLPTLPPAFDGYTLLQISDPHLDTSADIPEVLIDCIRRVDYDLCVLTGDFRTRTFGPHQPTLAALARVRPHLQGAVYAVLGNHDTLRLVPGMEALGIRVLLNEAVTIDRAGAALYLAGIDDAHYYRLHDVDKVARAKPTDTTAILLSHTPEAYREAAAAGFDFMLSGHTHGGQICLPGGFPLITDTTNCPRRFTKGAWRYENLRGYTSAGSGASIVDVRLNCPPEVTLHRLRRGVG